MNHFSSRGYGGSPHAAGGGLPPNFLRLTQILAIIMSVGIGLSVCVGLRGVLADDGGLSGWVVALAVSSILTGVLGSLWHIILSAAARLRADDSEAFWTVVALGAALTVVQAATSLPFLASAIGGGDAVRHHQERALSALSSHANGIVLHDGQRQQVEAAIAAEIRQLTALYEREVAGRGPSGQAGIGTVARSIAETKNQLAGTSERLRLVSSELTMALAQVQANIAAARAASAASNEAAFVSSYEAARTGLADARGRQSSALSSIIGPAAGALPELRDTMARVMSAGRVPTGTAQAPLPEYVAISRPRAVLSYPDAVPLAWSVAIAIDLLPLLMLVLLILAGRVSQDGPHDPGSGVRLRRRARHYAPMS